MKKRLGNSPLGNYGNTANMFTAVETTRKLRKLLKTEEEITLGNIRNNLKIP